MKSHKRQFKRFAGFYQKGQLQPHFIERLKNNYESGFRGSIGVVQSWFDYCKEIYGEIEQPLNRVLINRYALDNKGQTQAEKIAEQKVN